MRKALIFVAVGLAVFGILTGIFWRITKPVFNIVPEANGALLAVVFGIPLALTAGIMRLVWMICYGRGGRKR